MKNNKLKSTIVEVLKVDDRLWNNEKTELNQTLLLDLVDSIDGKVIDLILQNELLRDKFFVKIKNAYVFKTNDFKFFMEENKIDNSYTQYKNRIGLTDGKRFLKDTNDVVLNFPYKDCVLEGGQSNEEGMDTYFSYEEEKTKTVKGKKVTEVAGYKEKQAKRKEIFFNQVLAQDEIDRLFDEKALVNWKRFNKDGEVKVTEIKRDKNGIIKENLIIKGNNLLALHSLKSQFTGKVKLIYIDPPYNTGNDGFAYNDKFNHSSWLTFMKNRLEIAKDFLSDDGVIFVQCDDNEQAYLKVLMDDIFGRNNFINNIIPVMNPRGRQESAYPIAKSHEYIISYSKKPEMATLFNINKVKTDEISSYRLLGLRKSGNASKREDRPNMFYKIYYNENTKEISIYKKDGYDIEILPIKTNDNSESRWRWKKENVEANKHLLIIKKNSKDRYDVYEKNYTIIDGEAKGNKIQTFIKDVNIINDKAKEHLKELFNEEVFDYPKSEYLLKLLIEFATQPNDLIMDFHLGSGTTCSVAHKMGRRYIGIEQMDYIENIVVQRLYKVSKGEQGGISKAINWQGGGDFIYCELAKWNEQAKEEINHCNSLDELIKIFDSLYEKYFLNYNLKIKDFKEKLIKEDNFKNLSLGEQKRIFLTMLDLNQMYVNKSEMSDSRFNINPEYQKLTSEFYNSEK